MSAPATQWVPCELHAHSVHSDGRLTVEELAREMADLGIGVVALTDHNTTSGIREIAEAESRSGLTIAPGMELTTFYGHMVSLGTTAYIEWRTLSRTDINSAVDAIHAAGGLAGVVHPFHPGNPFCTGCYWEYEGLDWGRVDYLEVWSEPDPWRRPKNLRAFRLWDELLDSGHRLAAVSGTDFHTADRACLPAVTYVGINGLGSAGQSLAAGVMDALRAGRAFVTVGPLLSLAVRASAMDRAHGPGEVVPQSIDGARLEVEVSWGPDERRRFWEPHLQAAAVELHGDQGRLARGRAESATGSLAFSIDRQGHRWIRAELHGRARGEEAMIAFTNPVYMER